MRKNSTKLALAIALMILPAFGVKLLSAKGRGPDTKSDTKNDTKNDTKKRKPPSPPFPAERADKTLTAPTNW